MAIDVDAIWEALKDRLTTDADGFHTITRTPREQYGMEQYPVLEIVEMDETPSDDHGLPSIYTLSGRLGVSVRMEGDAPAAQRVNALVRAVRTALERKPGESGPEHHWTTLNLDSVVSLSLGRVAKSYGVIAGEAGATIEIEIQAL